MSAKYIIRLDDASEFMHYDKWEPFFSLFEKYNIFPIIAVIPNNKDVNLTNNKVDFYFWDKVRLWQKKRYVVALHGYQHVYSNKNAGILGINKYSEFAGVKYQKQLKMIQDGIEIFRKNGIESNMFVAPAHSFDHNTLKVLNQMKIEYISDGFFLNPINKNGINWIPQQLWKPKKKKRGIWTICIHPETSCENDIIMLNEFLRIESSNFIHPYNVLVKNLHMAEKIENIIISNTFKIKKIIKKLF